MDPGVVAALATALIASLTSIVIAVVTALRGRDAQRSQEAFEEQIQEKQRAHETSMAELADQLAAKRSELDARQDYEYAARQRLYEAVAPLTFQLTELSESAIGRIKSLARTAREGDLTPGKASWLDSEGYYYTSTLYRMLAPLAIGHLMRRQLTVVDLTLDREMATVYELVRQLSVTLTNDHSLAMYDPEIPYDPDSSRSGHGDEPGLSPDRRRQGVYSGWLDQALDVMVVNDGADAAVPRLITYGEFETLYYGESRPLLKLGYLFRSFHPGHHRVLWRVLVTQSLLYQAIIDNRDDLAGPRSDPDRPAIRRPIRRPDGDEANALDWREHGVNQASGEEAIQEPIDVAVAYLTRNLPHLMSSA